MEPGLETPLRARLASLLRELDVGAGVEFTADTSLLRSGLLDSLATVRLAEWIQQEVGSDVDLLAFDLAEEWETIARIERFIEGRRQNRGA